MKKFKELSEAIKDKFDIGEYDQEGDMAKSDLRSIIANSQKLHDMIEDADNLPEWVQSKITKAEDYISTVANYMAAEMNEAAESGVSKKKEEKFHMDLDKLVHKTFGHSPAEKKEKMKEDVEQIDELSSETLASYKKKASQQATEADKEGDYKKGDKRYSGIIKATNKQFANDMKKHQKEEVELDEVTIPTNTYRPRENGRFVTRKYKGQTHEKDPHGGGMLAKTKPAMNKEEVESLEEKNVPTSPEKWAQAKAQAKAKFDVYPSAYANGWAAKKYKEMGGGWKSVSEAKDDLPFTPDKPRKQNVIPGKHGVGYSTARHLARMAMQKQSEKMKKPIKEEEMSKKAQIVKKIAKKKDSSDTFQAEPVLSTTITKNN